MVGLVRRNEAVLIAIKNGRLEACPVGNSLLAIADLIFGQLLQADVEAELAHRGHVGAELDAGLLVPV